MAQLNDLLVLGKSTFKGAMRINNRITSYQAQGPRFIADDGTNTVWFGINANGNTWGLYNVVADKFIISDNGTKTTINNPLSANDIIPKANNTYDIGSTSLKWANIYAHNSIIVSEDETDEFYIDGGGSIASRVTNTAGWARSYSWKQRDSTSADFATICQMGTFGSGSTLKYWYVGTGYENANTWLQVNASNVLTRVPVRVTKGHLYLEGSNAGSSVGNTTQIVFGTSSTNHIVISSNDKALVLNPTTSTTANQIVLYLNTQSVFPGGLKVPTDNSAVSYFNNILPNATNTYTLGASDMKWKNIYSTNITVGTLQSNAIELYASSTSSNHGGYIDFHYNASTSDYTSRIIENANGVISINGSNFNKSGAVYIPGSVNCDGNIYLAERSLVKGTAPTETLYGSFEWRDQTNTTSGRGMIIQNNVNTENRVQSFWRVYKWEAGSSANAYMYITYNADGTTKAGSSAPFHGAVWNDYAEFRNYRDSNEIPYGRIVVENGDDSLSLASKRLQKGCNVCSDTFGFAIGETEINKMPIAVAGRALVYPYEERSSYSPGDAVCAAPGGTISKMTRQEIKDYPDCIVGYVSAIPDYEVWGERDTVVDGRIWIKVI